MNNRTYCGEIANTVSAKTRVELVARAKELNVRLTNGQARMKKDAAKWTTWLFQVLNELVAAVGFLQTKTHFQLPSSMDQL